MYCSNCGRKMEGGICSYCGYENDKGEEGEKNKNESKKTYLLLGVVTLAVVAIILCIIAFQKSESETFLGYLKEGSYDEAYRYYHTNLVEKEEELRKTYELVVGEMDALVEKYYSDQISYDDAKSGLSIYSDFYTTEVESAIDKIEKMRNSKSIFALAEQKYSEENFKEAYNYYLEVIAEDSNSSKAKERLKECYSFIEKQLFAIAEETAANGDYLEAVEQLEKELDFLVEEDKELANEKILEYERQYITEELEKVDSYLAANDYDKCYELLQRLNTSWSDVAEIQDAMEKTNSSYEKYIDEAVNMLMQERDFVSCIEVINRALVNLPASEKLSLLKEDVLDYFPVKLQDIYLFDNNLPGTKNNVENPKDMYQNEYEQGILYYDTSYQDYRNHYEYEERSETYLLNKEYIHFTATIAPSEKWTRDGLGEKYGTARFTIYGDGVQLFSASIWRDTKPVSIDIDVTGIEKLEIAFYRGHEGYFLLAEPYVYKNY